MKVQIVERTNQFSPFQPQSLVCTPDGTPKCPHCAEPMVRCAGGAKSTYQNATCKCWWVGANEGVYPLQIMVALNAQDEFEFQSSLKDAADRRAQADRDEEFKDRLAFAAADPESKFNIIARRLYLFGKRNKKARARLREKLANGATFDEAIRS